jgi:hypothetical protein
MFDEDAYFWETEFLRDVGFGMSRFHRDADFTNSKFNGNTYFEYSIFNRTAKFSGSQFKDNAYFSYSRFEDHLDFTKCKFNNIFNLRGSLFNHSISLKDVDFDTIYIDWDDIENTKKTFDGKVYLTLIENYKERGFFNDADSCYYQFRLDQLMHQNPVENFAKYLIDLGGWMFYGYGTRPDLPIIWSIFLIMIFGLVFWRNALKRTKIATQGRISVEDWLGFSAAVFLSGTKFFVDPPQIPEPLSEPNSRIKRVFIAERVLGALFSILLFLAISRSLIR